MESFPAGRRNGSPQDLQTTATSFVELLQACAQKKDLFKGTQIHADIQQRGVLTDTHIAGTLVSMYARCGVLSKAQQVHDELALRDVVSWCLLIGGYAEHGQYEEALICFEQMLHEGFSPNVVVLLSVLKSCGGMKAAKKGIQIHDEIANCGFLQKNILLGNALLDMYAKCGMLTQAQQVLDELPVRNVVTWSTLIEGYAQQGQVECALQTFDRMRCEGVSPDSVTFISSLKACSNARTAYKGQQIYDEFDNHGWLAKDVVIGTALIDMYVKYGALKKAREVLDKLPRRNVVSWSALIEGHVAEGRADEAMNLFAEMQHEGLIPNIVTFSSVLKACSILGAAAKGKQIHDKLVSAGLLRKSVELVTSLVDMYAKSGMLTYAQQVLNEFPIRDVVSWNALIAGYVCQQQGEQALNCFRRMQCEGISPDSVTFTCILKACGSIGALDKGEEVYSEIANLGFLGRSIMIGSALVDMFAKCGLLNKAQQLLDELPIRNIVCWNALIAGYAREMQGDKALNCFERVCCEGFSPDAATFTCVLNACCRTGLIGEGLLYLAAIGQGYATTPSIEHYTCLVSLFGLAGHFDKVLTLMMRMPCLYDSAFWSVILDACKIWGNMDLGAWAFEHAMKMDKDDAVSVVV